MGRLLTLSFLALLALSGTNGQRTNSKIVDAYCLRIEDENAVEMHFTADFGENTVDKVLAVSGDTYIINTDGTTNEASCSYTGNIVTDKKIHIMSKVYSSGQASVNPCGVRRPSVNSDIWDWTIQLKEKFAKGATTDLDRSYNIRCQQSSWSSNKLTTYVNVFQSTNKGNGNRLRPQNEMLVLTRNGNSNTYRLPSGGISIGEYVKLRVQTLSATNRQVNFDPYGSYVFSCDVRYSQSSTRLPFIAATGCPPAGNPFGLTQGFRYAQFQSAPVQQRWFQTDTQPFVMIPTTPPNDNIILSCYIGYCFGTPVEAKCNDYCDYITRKRRSAQADYDLVTFVVNIKNETASTVEGQTSDQMSSSTLIVVITVVAVLAVVGVFAALFVFMCVRSRRDQKATGSISGSQVNLPAHLTHDYIGTTKA